MSLRVGRLIHCAYFNSLIVMSCIKTKAQRFAPTVHASNYLDWSQKGFNICARFYIWVISHRLSQQLILFCGWSIRGIRGKRRYYHYKNSEIIRTTIKSKQKLFKNLVRKLNQEIQLAQIICWFEETEHPKKVSLFYWLVLHNACWLNVLGARDFIHQDEESSMSPHY